MKKILIEISCWTFVLVCTLFFASLEAQADFDPSQHLYCYRAKINSVYDGDSARMDIDLGLSIWDINTPIRLARIDAPEVRGSKREQGIIVRNFVRDLLAGKNNIVCTQEKGKYGRWIAEVWFYNETHWVNLSDRLLSEGLVKPYP